VFIIPDDGFQPSSEFSSWQHHTPFAAQTFQTDIGTQASNPPLITAAGMWFSQAYDIVQV
jgi:hypothetical protein